MFAQQKVTLPKGRHKIIILDEADSMTEVNLFANLWSLNCSTDYVTML